MSSFHMAYFILLTPCSSRLPNKLLNDSHLCACEQATCGSISRFFERTEESFGDFQFMAEEARGGAVFLVGVVTHGEVAERGHHS